MGSSWEQCKGFESLADIRNLGTLMVYLVDWLGLLGVRKNTADAQVFKTS
jgi:hypothetical protein